MDGSVFVRSVTGDEVSFRLGGPHWAVQISPNGRTAAPDVAVVVVVSTGPGPLAQTVHLGVVGERSVPGRLAFTGKSPLTDNV